MMMKFSGPLLVVKDINKSRKFYEEVLGAHMTMDLGGNMPFDEGFSLQDIKYWAMFLGKKEEEIIFGGDDKELYFETDEFDAFIAKFRTFDDILLREDVKEYPWGQNVIRFCDPDLHIIEVAQSMKSVVWRFLDEGMTPEQVSERVQHPMGFIEMCIAEGK